MLILADYRESGYTDRQLILKFPDGDNAGFLRISLHISEVAPAVDYTYAGLYFCNVSGCEYKVISICECWYSGVFKLF
jgi:hypothetical protein